MAKRYLAGLEELPNPGIAESRGLIENVDVFEGVSPAGLGKGGRR
jgi:hypothetical protein